MPRNAVKIKRSHLVIWVIVVLAWVWWVRGFWLTEVFHSQKSNEPNRTALLGIYDAVALGSSYDDVLKAYWQHRTRSLGLSAERPTDWSISMPLEFGATDWRLHIEFRDDKVSALRVRTSDGPPPNGAPSDKESNK